MTPARMAALHAAAFVTDRPWSEAEFSDLLTSPHVQVFAAPHGFALTRTIADESELLTLAVHPDHHRQGIAASLLRAWLAEVTPRADTAFLEVAADNHAAHALYAAHRFDQIATRPAYYRRKGAQAVDALIFQRALTHG